MAHISKTEKPLPPRPDLVMRVGFAGNRDLPQDPDGQIPAAIEWLLDKLAHRLAEFAPGVPVPEVPPGSPEHILKFYSQNRPTLRLVSGLAEGADTLISREFQKRQDAPQEDVGPTLFRQSAIFPFQTSAYRESRDEDARSTFDELLSCCTHVIELDGPDKPYPFGTSGERKRNEEKKIHRDRRNHAYRAQSQLILRNCDLMITMADRSRQGGAGGTLETIREAQYFQLPVVHIDIESEAVDENDDKKGRQLKVVKITLVEPGEPFKGAFLDDEFFTVSNNDCTKKAAIEDELNQWIKVVVAGPNLGFESEEDASAKHQHLEFLTEYFDDVSMPPKGGPKDFVRTNFGTGWKGFEEWAGDRAHDYQEAMKPIKAAWERAIPQRTNSAIPQSPTLKGDQSQDFDEEKSGHSIEGDEIVPDNRTTEKDMGEKAKPLLQYRNRTTRLNYYYSDLYRGGFALSFFLAVAAVCLAGLSLLIIGEEKTFRDISSEMFSSLETKDEQHGDDADSHGHNHDYIITLTIIVVIKLIVVSLIFALTTVGNRRKWNERAINYRYLAERMRPMYYLPQLGSFQPPAAGTAQYASRALAQGIFDWLFDAIVRSTNPLDVLKDLRFENSNVIRLNPEQARRNVREGLIGYLKDEKTQRGHHHKTAKKNHGLSEFIEPLTQILTISVIVVVVFDLILIGLELGFYGEPPGVFAKRLAPWAAFLTALIPAAIAALNGIRFQSECLRLSDRSRMMIGIFKNHLLRFERLESRMEKYSDETGETANPYSWNTDVLLATEACVLDMARESAEWTVLYAKEMPEN